MTAISQMPLLSAKVSHLRVNGFKGCDYYFNRILGVSVDVKFINFLNGVRSIDIYRNTCHTCSKQL